MGYIKFPVFKDCSYIVNACGSKITCSGFYFSTTGTEKVELIGATNLTIDEGSVEPVETTATVTFIVDDSNLKTATGFSLKGSWITATGVYDASCDGGAVHTQFYDDGTNGDKTAGDHIWSVNQNLVVNADVTWKWGINDAKGNWAIVGDDQQFTLTDATDKTVTYVNTVGINDMKSSATIVKTEYYNSLGVKLIQPANGLNIIRKTMSDGSIVTSKSFINK